MVWAATGALGAIVLIGAYATWSSSSNDSDERERSIAVLPFINMSGDSANEYFSDGMTEDLVANLASIADLRVVSRTSVMGYKGTRKNLRDIARELGVAYVVEGSVRRDGNRVRVTAQLIEADDDGHLWAENYDRELTDIFAIQTEIARTIANRLEAELSTEESRRLASIPTTSIAAYDLYLKARERLGRMNPRDAALAADLFGQAIALDPSFALAHGWQARAYGQRGTFEGPAMRDSARAAAARALRLEPDLAVAWVAIGALQTAAGRTDSARVSMLRAIESEPNDAETMAALAGLFEITGEYDQVVRWARAATIADPNSANAALRTAIGHLYLKQDSIGLEWGLRAYALDPSLQMVQLVVAQMYVLNGRVEEGVRRLDEADAGDEPARLLVARAGVASWSGDYATAREHYEAAIRLRPVLADYLAADRAYAAYRTGEDPARVAALTAHAERFTRARIAGGDITAEPYLELAALAIIRGDDDAAIEALRGARARNFTRFDTLGRFFWPGASVLQTAEFRRLAAEGDADVRRMWRKVVDNGW
jgi:adenylate cyclase